MHRSPVTAPLPDRSEGAGAYTIPAVVEPLAPGRVEEAVDLLARAFVTNPLHVAAFGAGRLDLNRAFFRTGLRAIKGARLAAADGGRLLGVAHWAASPACRFSGGEKLRMLPGLVRGLGARPALRLLSWLSAWERHDPAEPHLHLGPIGVDPAAQGRGIGRALMEAYRAEADRAGLAGYLETDRPANVGFYERFGFEVVGTETILGVRNFFMRRAPRPSA